MGRRIYMVLALSLAGCSGYIDAWQLRDGEMYCAERSGVDRYYVSETTRIVYCENGESQVLKISPV